MDHSKQNSFEREPAESRSARANRACAACRARKQRCILPETAGQAACQRCAHHRMTCSFENEPAESVQEHHGPTKLAQMVVELQQRVNRHEARIAELEYPSARSRKYPRLLQEAHATASTASIPTTSDDGSRYSGQHEGKLDAVPQKFNNSMEQLELGAPIATLRSLGALSERRGPEHRHKLTETNARSADLVATGKLTEKDASRALNIYFDHCHPWAPVLNQKTRDMGIKLKEYAPTLFLSIVAIGARFWHEDDRDNDSYRPNSTRPIKLHPQYLEIIKVLDANVSRLLLRPCAADASLNTIQSLLLYVQWMPYDLCVVRSAQLGGQSAFQTRYNEISTWAVFGLALRYAGFCGLEQRVLGLFNDDVTVTAATEEDLDTMRVWLNLVTYDCNLTLTSGMPTSLDPKPMNERAYRFCSHQVAQQPGDVRYAAMVQLACIIRDVRYEKDNIADKNQVLAVIARANEDFDAWQRRWIDRLSNTRLQQLQMPFTSVRWYRLALNSSLLRAVLSRTLPEMLPLPAWAPEPLSVSLTAASQILLSVSKSSFQCILSLESQRPSTFPEGIILLDTDARLSLHHAVDSTWISYTFAITFLVLCYLRKIIDDDLQLCAPHESTALLGITAPAKPRPISILYRLSRLALDIFGCSGQTSFFRPDNDFTTVVQNATSLILDEDTITEPTVVQPNNNSSIQAFFDLMEDPTWDWGMPFSEEQTEWDM